MIASLTRTSLLVGAMAVLGVVGTGCATKKYVKTQIDPVTGRVVEVEKKNAEQQAALGQLENQVSQADERAMDAEKKATAAGQAASQVGQQLASTRNELGQQITGVRDESQRKFGEVESNVNNINPANYKQVLEENILFRFGKSTISDEAKQKLDQIAENLKKMPNYSIEIQGFTDKTGGSAYNLNLSRERAQAVVRYLAAKHQIPLRRIQLLGVGEVDSTERGKEARAQARRVEMRVFAPESAVAQMQGRSAGQ